MDKRFIPVAMLAGALALAGCGGGSNTTAGGTEPPTCDDDQMLVGGQCVAKEADDEDDDDPTPATLSGTGLTEAGEIRLVKDQEYETPNNGIITCTADECVITVADQRGTPRVTVTSGTATFEPYDERLVANTGDRTGGVTGGTDWLSNRALLGAVREGTGTNIYVEITAPNGAPARGRTTTDGIAFAIPADNSGGQLNTNPEAHEAASPGGSATNHIVVDTLGGRETDLRLVHTRGRTITGDDDDVVTDRDTLRSDYLVFGAWERRTSANTGPQSKQQLGYVHTGTIPRTDPGTFGIGDARYEGKALGHYSHGGGDWEEWEGTVHLEANFAPQERQIEGTINIPAGDDYGQIPAAHSLGTINLKTASIGSDASGDAGIAGGVGSGSGSTGRWHADFYGTAINGAPNGVAGDFRTQRPEITRLDPDDNVVKSVQVKASIQGAFGAHNVGQLADTDQQ